MQRILDPGHTGLEECFGHAWHSCGKDVYWGESSDTGVYHFRGRNLSIESGAWNGGHIMLGSSHLWVDSIGRLRIKGSAPTSETDGTVVGTQS
jgi:hypothetical protein